MVEIDAYDLFDEAEQAHRVLTEETDTDPIGVISMSNGSITCTSHYYCEKSPRTINVEGTFDQLPSYNNLQDALVKLGQIKSIGFHVKQKGREHHGSIYHVKWEDKDTDQYQVTKNEKFTFTEEEEALYSKTLNTLDLMNSHNTYVSKKICEKPNIGGFVDTFSSFGEHPGHTALIYSDYGKYSIHIYSDKTFKLIISGKAPFIGDPPESDSDEIINSLITLGANFGNEWDFNHKKTSRPF